MILSEDCFQRWKKRGNILFIKPRGEQGEVDHALRDRGFIQTMSYLQISSVLCV